jgi:hypothetical protein
MGYPFPYNEDELKQDPDVMLDHVKQLYQKTEELEIQYEERIRLLTDQIDLLNKKIQLLEAHLTKYTSPHIPTSKQLYPKKKIGKQSGMPKQPRGKRGGSKKGKSGAIWDQKEPDVVINNYVKECLNCHQLTDESGQTISYSKVILEIPEVIPVSLQQHHVYKYQCDCGKTTQAAAPTLEGTALGPNFLTFLTTARFRTGGSFENLSKLIEDNAGVKPSQTALNRGLSKISTLLEPVADTIATEVMNSKWINIDETGHKLVLEGNRAKKGSKKVWVWVFATPNAAYYHIDMHRDKKALQKVLQLREPDRPPPISVSDAYPAYLNTFETKQFCWAHLLRDSKEIEDHCLEGKLLHDRLYNVFESIKKAKSQGTIDEKAYVRNKAKITKIAETRSRCDCIRKIQNHLKKRGEHYLTCLKHQAVPMTNNHAERLLKTVIVHRSNGKPLRSIKAMKEYGVLLSVLTTWKLKGLPLGATLKEAIAKQIDKAKLLD